MPNTRSALILPPLLMFLLPSTAQGPAPAPAPAPALDCAAALRNLSACLTYVGEGSNLTMPEKGCCRGLSGLVGTHPVCLCQLLSSSDALGVRIDTVKALMLPTACRVDTPPATLCAVLGIPVASPVTPAPPAATSRAPEVPGSPVGSRPSAGSGTPAAWLPTKNGGSSTPGATGLGFAVRLLFAGTMVISVF